MLVHNLKDALANRCPHFAQKGIWESGSRRGHLHKAQQRGADLVLGLEIQRQHLRGKREHLHQSKEIT